MPWAPGQSGNPKGRAPRTREQKYLRATLKAVSLAAWREIVQTAVEEAKAGGPDGAKARQWLAAWILPRPEAAEQTKGFDLVVSANEAAELERP